MKVIKDVKLLQILLDFAYFWKYFKNLCFLCYEYLSSKCSNFGQLYFSVSSTISKYSKLKIFPDLLQFLLEYIFLELKVHDANSMSLLV